MAFQKRKQDPADKLDYGFNWADPKAPGGGFLLDGETLTASTWLLYDENWATVTDVAVSGDSNTDTTTTVFYGPATDVTTIVGATRYLTNHITTNQGREKEMSYQFTMEEQ